MRFPPVDFSAGDGIHGLMVAAVVTAIADKIADNTAAQPTRFGSGSADLDGIARLFADARPDPLGAVRGARTDVDRADPRRHGPIIRGPVTGGITR